jgi:hypothetical protein
VELTQSLGSLELNCIVLFGKEALYEFDHCTHYSLLEVGLVDQRILDVSYQLALGDISFNLLVLGKVVEKLQAGHAIVLFELIKDQ